MRRIFRGILSLCLVLAMLTMGCITGLCEEVSAAEEELDYISFEPTITKMFDNSASEWFSSEFDRAMLTVLLSIDLLSIVDEDVMDFSEALTKNTYVAKDGLNLIVYYHGKQSDLLVGYTPLTGTAIYQVQDKIGDSLVLYLLEKLAEDGCYKNDIDDLFEVVTLLSDVLTD